MSLKNIKRLLALSILMFFITLITIVFLLLKDPKEYIYQSKEDMNKTEDGPNVISNVPQKKEDILPNQELIPRNEALQKDQKLDIKQIEESSLNMKEPKVNQDQYHSTYGRKVVYIYFSHNRESFLPYFSKGTSPEMAYHSKFNVSIVGERLSKSLRVNGIGSLVSTTDIIPLLHERGLSFNSSYSVSREMILNEKNINKDLDIYLDIHRDSLPKEYTTTLIKGNQFAKILFVIGSGHESFESNLAFTKDINVFLEDSYPGLSKGIIIKDKSQGNGVYNQDLSPNSVIIEIGGVENNIEELYRSADALGDAVSQYYWTKEH
ncbi:stage II sporulation protein P [Metabacillus idriensis]|uniref:stage II sporulation protein P n=1 Tax=Metabacillus idriensis TaxID=324768 RepID=UPI001749F5A3|nr:stage II sporulation protein P [Metabacillus idriensis]